ncbi:thioredoxin family protein [Chelativorans sp. AA-79]|uniref:thioredoxin family protein n=1 Tax=Chelativorans sp. AA-79 TaxID=3028735 RepID=UPI0023F871DB|nr:thioredoxin family protein [Chelativorans sp. AA-79]WEX09243.1 thioredoxin family protein [Chelativorans sp. AA-79]
MRTRLPTNAVASTADVGCGIDGDAQRMNGQWTRRGLLLGGLVGPVGLLTAPIGMAIANPAAMATDVASYRERLEQVARTHRFALIDIRADWCAVCHRIEREILAHPAVLQRLQAVPLVKVDVTVMDEGNRQLLSHLRASGPPTFFVVEAVTGREYDGTRSVGSFSRRDLMRRLRPFIR